MTDAHVAAGGSGNPMPPAALLPQPSLDLVEQWIDDGALP
jgi:hypothetical protein